MKLFRVQQYAVKVSSYYALRFFTFPARLELLPLALLLAAIFARAPSNSRL